MHTSGRKPDSDADPGDRPFTAADFGRMRRTPQVKVIRRALGLTQEQFAARYQVPLTDLREWEDGRAEPDPAVSAYLRVIAAEPLVTARALEGAVSARRR